MDNAGPSPTLAFRIQGYLVATAGVTLLGVLAETLPGSVEPTNLVMLYLLVGVAVALRYSYGPAAWSAVLGVLAFDYFHVPPRGSLAVGDVKFLPTFAVMLLVGLLLAHLTARLRTRARAAAAGERAARGLQALARSLSGTIAPTQVCEQVRGFVEAGFAGTAELWWQGGGHALAPVGGEGRHDELFAALLGTVMAEGRGREQDDPYRAGRTLLILPLEAPARRRGVLVASLPDRSDSFRREQLEAVALLAAIALERLHYVDVAQRAVVEMEQERLRSTLLSALSHDIRTPLTVMVGQAEALAEASGPRVGELASALRQQALRMGELVNKLLDMARLQATGVALRRDWQSLEEIVGAALAHLDEVLAAHRLLLDLPESLPLLEFDAVLIERVLCNLLENAAKFTPPGRSIRVQARVEGEWVRVAIEDEGPGLPPGDPARLFEPFVRGDGTAAVSGLGLGLSICRIIVEAHGGRLDARNRGEGGACFGFTLPCSEQPLLAVEGEAVHG